MAMARTRSCPACTILCRAAVAVLSAAGTAAAQALPATPDYAEPAFIDSRLAVWIVAQLHLMFAAFVLAVPMFALFIEYIGWRAATSDTRSAARYDWPAHELARLLPAAASLAASTGASPAARIASVAWRMAAG